MERKSVLKLINEAASSKSHNIVVLPLMCGSGKSSAISEKMAEAIRNGEGIMIVTDRTYRFNEYQSPRDKELKKFLKDKKDEIAVIKAGKTGKKDRSYMKCPVLMMTSQRFLRLNEEELFEYLLWKSGKRSTIIFDEKPELYFQYNLSIDEVNKFEIAFFSGVNLLSSKAAIQKEEKETLSGTWFTKRNNIVLSLLFAEPKGQSIQNSYSFGQTLEGLDDETTPEYINTEGLSPEEKELALEFNQSVFQEESNRRFFNAVKKYSRYFYRQNAGIDPQAFLRALWLRENKNNLYSYRSGQTGKYQSYYAIIQSEVQKMQNTGSHVVILDGTADLSMDYNQEGIFLDRESSKQYIRQLEKLTICLVECKTTKSTLSKRNKKLLNLFIRYIEDDSQMSSVCVFSYMDLIALDKNEKLSESENPEYRMEYFGNIKGRNTFQEYDVFGQVGINVCPESYYLSRYIDQHNDIRTKLIHYGTDSEKEINKLIRNQDFKTAKYRDILAELEQNVFRSKIRTPENTDEIKYYIFYEFSEHKGLRDMIYDRFQGLYGAHVEERGEASYILDLGKTISRKGVNGKDTISQRLIEASDKIPSGTEFQITEFLETTATDTLPAITKRQFNSSKQKNDVVKARFSGWLIDAHAGIYRKP